jgi:hypothetical protein
MQKRDRLIGTSRLVVRIALITNRLFLAAVVVGLALSCIFQSWLASFLADSNPGVDVPSLLTGVRLVIVIGIVMAVATDRLLAALGALIASAGAGDPFIAENAARLRTIGWALLALQLLDIPAALITRFVPSLGTAAPDGDISFGGWMAVLMVFVLSRVFAAGSAMRDDLEGTV